MASTDPLIVALYGGPGTGKSTTAALLFAELKLLGYNAELVTEYAKDLTWEQRRTTLGNQPYVTAKQLWHLDRLSDQVDVIITDTSPLLALIYGHDLVDEFKAYIKADWKARRTVDIFLRRDPSRPYNVRGRAQSATQATKLDQRIKELLRYTGTPYTEAQVSLDGAHVRRNLLHYVERNLVEVGEKG